MEPNKEELEDAYLNNSNLKCQIMLGISDRKMYKLIDLYGIERKGAHPGSMMKPYYFVGKAWIKPTGYRPYDSKYLFGAQWMSINGLRSKDRL